MIRGTNKRIIEISGEDGSCFERIVLFLRPEQDAANEQRMLKMAEDYADGIFKSGAPVSMLKECRRQGKRRFDLKKLAAAAIVALVAAGAVALCFAML